MNVRVDHVVIWVRDPLRSLEFYEKVLGFPALRVEEFRAGRAPFPSVRLSDETLLDLAPEATAERLNAMGGKLAPVVAASAGQRLHHVCLAMSRSECAALRSRIEAAGGKTVPMTEQFGARGVAPEAFYFHDPDGNVFEARYYEA